MSEPGILDHQTFRLEDRASGELLASAKEFYRKGLYPKASRWLQEVIRQHPYDGEAFYWLGSALVRRGRLLEAIVHLHKASKTGFDRPEVHLRLGEAYLAQSEKENELESVRQSKRDLAIDEFGRAISMAQTVPMSDGRLEDAYIGAVRVEVGRDNPDAALAHLESALRQDPDANVTDWLHTLLPGRSDLDQVIHELRRIIHRSREPEAYLALSQLLSELYRSEAAFLEYLWYIARYAKRRDAQRSDRPQLQLFSRSQGEPSLRPFPERQQPLSRDAVTKGQRLVQQLKYPLVEAVWGYYLIALGVVPLGLDVQRRALERASTNPDVYLIVGWSVKQLDPVSRKSFLVEWSALVDCVGKPEAHVAWGYVLSDLGELEAAARAFEKSNSPDGYLSWASLLTERDPEQALALLGEAIDRAELAGEVEPWLVDRVDMVSALFAPANRFRLVPTNQASMLLDRIDRHIRQSAKRSTLLTWGLTLAELDRPRQALTRFQQVLLADGSSSRLSLGSRAFNALSTYFKRYPKLLVELLVTVEDSRNPIAHAELLSVLMTGEYLSEAQRLCEAWIRLAPDDCDPFYKLGEICVKQKRFERATIAYERAIERVPDDTGAYLEYLNAIQEMDIQSGAIGKLLTVVRAWNTGRNARADWPEIERLRDQVTQKLTRAIQAFKENVDYADQYASFADRIAQQGLTQQAAKLLENAYRQYPHNFWDHFLWGVLLMRLGDYKGAIRQLRQDIRNNPSRFSSYVERANCHIGLDHFKAASIAFDLALRKGTEFDDDRGPDGSRIDGYVAWAIALTRADLHEEALARANQACLIKDDDYWALFGKAYVLASMNAYEQAEAYYARAIQADSSIPNAHHNMLVLLEEQGLYQSARIKLDETLRVYQSDVENKLKARNSYLFSFYALRCLAAKDESRTEDLLRMGRFLDPDNPEYDAHLAKFYFEREKDSARSPRGLSAFQETERIKTPARFKALDHYRRAEAGIKRRLRYGRSMEALLMLGDLYIAAGEFEKARATFEEAATRQPISLRAHTGLGECHIKDGNPKQAIRALETALRLAPDNLEVQLLAAQAFRRGEKLDEAQEAYRRVLNTSPCHVDALVGLGELYLDMAEGKIDQKDKSGLAELYSKAVDNLTLAVNHFDAKDTPLTVASSKSSTLYLIGYSQVKLHQTSPLLRDKTLLDSAIKYFKACGKGHVKAQQALAIISGEQKGFVQSRIERFGGLSVICLSLLLFLLAQIGMIFGRPVHHERLTFGPEMRTVAESKGIPNDLLAKVKPLEGESFRNEEIAATKLKDLVGPDGFSKFGSQIMAAAERSQDEIGWESVDLGSYLMLTFGSVLLMIAGAYLPQLTTLKLAGVQLEKVSAERVERATITIGR